MRNLEIYEVGEILEIHERVKGAHRDDLIIKVRPGGMCHVLERRYTFGDNTPWRTEEYDVGHTYSLDSALDDAEEKDIISHGLFDSVEAE